MGIEVSLRRANSEEKRIHAISQELAAASECPTRTPWRGEAEPGEGDDSLLSLQFCESKTGARKRRVGVFEGHINFRDPEEFLEKKLHSGQATGEQKKHNPER